MEIFPYPNAYRFIVDNTVGSVIGVLADNGHVPTLTVDQVKTPAAFIGGPCGAHTLYKLQQINFHFGCDASRGSEHAVDGKVYSGEINPVQTIM